MILPPTAIHVKLELELLLRLFQTHAVVRMVIFIRMLLFYVYHATHFVPHALVMQITLAYRANHYLGLLEHLLLAYVIAFLAIIRIPSISLALHATILIVAFAQE